MDEGGGKWGGFWWGANFQTLRNFENQNDIFQMSQNTGFQNFRTCEGKHVLLQMCRLACEHRLEISQMGQYINFRTLPNFEHQTGLFHVNHDIRTLQRFEHQQGMLEMHHDIGAQTMRTFEHWHRVFQISQGTIFQPLRNCGTQSHVFQTGQDTYVLAMQFIEHKTSHFPDELRFRCSYNLTSFCYWNPCDTWEITMTFLEFPIILTSQWMLKIARQTLEINPDLHVATPFTEWMRRMPPARKYSKSACLRGMLHPCLWLFQ